MTDCRIISNKNGMYLVEWRDSSRLRRNWVPERMVVNQHDKTAVVNSPERGLPFGVDWDRVLPPLQATAEMLAEELRRRGIWTPDDLRASPGALLGALQTVYGVDMAAILNAVRHYERTEDLK